MATLKQAIYAVLEDDAKLTGQDGQGNDRLGELLGHTAADPYGIYFSHPPEIPDLPLITYFYSTQTGRFPRIIDLMVTAWGSIFEALQERCYQLLHDTSLLADATDFTQLMCKWDWAGPPLWEQELKTYYQAHRYLIKAIKK